jgi:hypothetical protein
MPRLDAEGAPAGKSEPEQPLEMAAENQGEKATLPHGDALTLDEAASLCAARQHRLIVILGDHGAGKTTLLAEFH